MMETIAFLGLGMMGEPMAARLVEAGFRPRVWARNRGKILPLVQKGAVEATDPDAASRGTDIVILMFDTAQTTKDILFERGVAKALSPGSLVIDMSSNSPGVARDCATRLAEIGIHHLDAPVSGGTVGARQGTLAIMAGGEEASFDRALALFDTMGRATLIGSSGTGQLAKLVNQVIVAVTIGAVAEALLLARVHGVDPAVVQSALTGGFADSKILQLHGARMIERRFEPGGTVLNQLKDLDAANRVANQAGITLPLMEQARSAFSALAAEGEAQLDHSAMFVWLERLNKLDWYKPS